jgi:hypothetical protein
VGQAELAGQSAALFIQVCPRRRELLVERRKASFRFGKLSAGGIEAPTGQGGRGFCGAKLAIQLAAPVQILLILLLKAPDTVPNPGKFLLGLSCLGRSGAGLFSRLATGLAGSRCRSQPGWQGQEQRQT